MSDTFQVLDSFYSNRLWMHNDIEVQFKDHKAIVPPEVAYQMSRFTSEFGIEEKVIPYNPESWKKDRRIIWSCNVSSANGYGMVAENTIKWLRNLGVNVLNPKTVSASVVSGGEFVDEEVLKALNTTIKPDCLEIQHCQPPALRFGIVDRIWTYTMFETTHMPNSWIKRMNKLERVIAPSSWLIKVWKEQGLTVPVSVIGHGIDPSIYYFLERPERETFSFLHLGRLSDRKGTDLVCKAFLEEFKGQNDVKLILKHTEPFSPLPFDTPNYEFISATYSKEQMRELYRRADCFVFPTRGEGFGLPPFEAMATGLPTIVTNWSGCADFIDKTDTLALDYDMTRAFAFDKIHTEFLEPGEDCGYWAEPKLDHLKYLMRWAYEHRAKAKQMGKKAANRLAKEWTWEAQMKKMIKLFDTTL